MKKQRDGNTPAGSCCRLVAMMAWPNTKHFKMSETLHSSVVTIETYRLNRSEPLRIPCVESITSRYPSCGLCQIITSICYMYISIYICQFRNMEALGSKGQALFPASPMCAWGEADWAQDERRISVEGESSCQEPRMEYLWGNQGLSQAAGS
jgi:hypothetical protein